MAPLPLLSEAAPLDPSAPPFVPLQPDETLLHCHLVEYADRAGLAWLTSRRVLLRADRATPALREKRDKAGPSEADKAPFDKPEQFQLPLANIEGFKQSAVTSATSKVMLQLSYLTRGGTQVSKLVLRFVGPAAQQDRTAWHAVLSELKLAQLPEVKVKPEPGTQASPAVAAAAAPAPAAAATSAAPAPASAPAPAAAPTPAPVRPAVAAGAKRGHAQMSSAAPAGSSASASAASAASAVPSAAAPAAASAAPSASEIEALIKSRAALLARDSALKDLHADLVPKAVSEDEFWATPQRIAMLREEQARQNLPDVGGGSGGLAGGPGSASYARQRVGVSSSMGVIKPETGCNVVRYTLDAAAIHAIFLENPVVHELYTAMVPAQLSEKEFWTKYFKSQYVHAQAAASGQAAANAAAGRNNQIHVDDIFARAKAMQEARDNQAHPSAAAAAAAADPVLAAQQAEERDRTTKATLLSRAVDPSVDLSAADASEAVMGQDVFLRSAGGAAAPLAPGNNRSKRERAQKELLQRYNRHGMLVLDASNPHGHGHNATAVMAAPSSAAGLANSATAMEQAELRLQKSYHAGLSKQLELADLSREQAPVYNELHLAGGVLGGAGGQGRGTSGPFAAALGSAGDKKPSASALASTPEAVLASSRSFRAELSSWARQAGGGGAEGHAVPREHLPSSAVAAGLVGALTNMARGMNKAALATRQLREAGNSTAATSESNGLGLSSASSTGGTLLVFSTDGVTADTPIPSQFSTELKKRYATCAELFRHFWASLNPRGGAAAAAKLRRIHAALREQHAFLELIQQNLHARQFSALVPVLTPLRRQIEKCDSTFRVWESKAQDKKALLQQRQQQQQQQHRRNATANASSTPPRSDTPPTEEAGASTPPGDDATRDAKRVRVA